MEVVRRMVFEYLGYMRIAIVALLAAALVLALTDLTVFTRGYVTAKLAASITSAFLGIAIYFYRTTNHTNAKSATHFIGGLRPIAIASAAGATFSLLTILATTKIEINQTHELMRILANPSPAPPYAATVPPSTISGRSERPPAIFDPDASHSQQSARPPTSSSPQQQSASSELTYYIQVRNCVRVNNDVTCWVSIITSGEFLVSAVALAGDQYYSPTRFSGGEPTELFGVRHLRATALQFTVDVPQRVSVTFHDVPSTILRFDYFWIVLATARQQHWVVFSNVRVAA